MQFVRLSDHKKNSQIDAVLKSVNMLPHKEKMINTLSGGEQQRIALARTILKPGELILADEPTGALDSDAAERAFSLIQNMCKRHNKTVIMVTHSMELAQRADRIIDLTYYDCD